MKINNYSFGSITINGKTYNSDVIVYPDKVKANWLRKEGHSLCIDDIKEVLDAKPEVIIVGCGASGVLKVLAKTKLAIEEKGIELIILPTDEAVKRYNEIAEKKLVIACLHLTC
jgi:hypothetical protein